MNQIPAGTSKKTGLAYDSFMSCPNRCKSPINNTKPNPDPFTVLSEQLLRVERKIDFLMDSAKTPEQRQLDSSF